MRHFVSQPKSSNIFTIFISNGERVSPDSVLSNFLKAFSKAIEVRLDVISQAVADPGSYSKVLAPKELEVIESLFLFVQQGLRHVSAADSPGYYGTNVFTYSNLNTGACVSLILCEV